jgi:hypothetical protein
VAQTGAFSGTFPRDGKMHTIRVEAPEYQAKLLSFSADDDHTFDVSLVPLKEQAAAPPPASHSHVRAPDAKTAPQPPQPAPPAPANAAQPAPQPSAGGHSKQQIDEGDPYAK